MICDVMYSWGARFLQPTIELVAHVLDISGIFLSDHIAYIELFKTIRALRYVFFLVPQHAVVNFLKNIPGKKTVKTPIWLNSNLLFTIF